MGFQSFKSSKPLTGMVLHKGGLLDQGSWSEQIFIIHRAKPFVLAMTLERSYPAMNPVERAIVQRNKVSVSFRRGLLRSKQVADCIRQRK